MTLELDHAFMIRSSSHMFRVKVTVEANDNSKVWQNSFEVVVERPYIIKFKNLMQEKPPKILAIEHTALSDKVNPGKQAGYQTDISHWYEMRLDDELKASVSLDHAAKAEL